MMGNEEPEDLDTERCITCGDTLAQSWCDEECFACIARGEDLQNEAEDAEEGREECEAELKCDHDFDANGQCHICNECEREPVETFTESVKEIGIPRDLAKLVLAELSPQWHTKAVRELLRTIEEQL